MPTSTRSFNALSLLLAGAALLTGCAGPSMEPEKFQAPAYRSVLLERNSEAASSLARQVRREGMHRHTLVVLPIARTASVGSTSLFGRTLSEHLASRLAALGFNVHEPRLVSEPLTRGMALSEGEAALALANAVNTLTDQTPVDKSGAVANNAEASVPAQAGESVARLALSGTYSRGAQVVTISLKVFDLKERTVIAGHTYMVSTKEFDKVAP